LNGRQKLFAAASVGTMSFCLLAFCLNSNYLHLYNVINSWWWAWREFECGRGSAFNVRRGMAVCGLKTVDKMPVDENSVDEMVWYLDTMTKLIKTFLITTLLITLINATLQIRFFIYCCE
jgi:hypothetical protein